MDGILSKNSHGIILDPRVHHPKDEDGRPVPGLWICINGMTNNNSGAVYGAEDAYEVLQGRECQMALIGKNGVYNHQNGGTTAISPDNKTYVSLYYGSQTQDRWAVDQHMQVGNYGHHGLWVLVTAHDPIPYGNADTKMVWDRFKSVQDRHSNYVQSGDRNNQAYESLIGGSFRMDPQRQDHPLYPEAQELLKPNFIGYCGTTNNGKTWFMTVDGVLFINKTAKPEELKSLGFMPISTAEQAILGVIEFSGSEKPPARTRELTPREITDLKTRSMALT